MRRFENRVVLISAGGGGIGRGIALRLAAEGGTVAIWDRDLAMLHEASDEAASRGFSLATLEIDMTDSEAIPVAVEKLVAEHGRIDVLVNNVGGSLHTPFKFLEQSDEDWSRVLDANINTAVRLTRAVVPHMISAGYGRIVNTGSKAGRYGSLFAGANYVAAKGAVQAFTLQIAQEFGPHGITCNAVCPGAILTPRLEGLLAERQTPEERERVVHSIPMRRHGQIEDVAAAIAYLASEEASFVTGVSLDVNGGQSMAL